MTLVARRGPGLSRAAVAGQLLWHFVVKESRKAKRPEPKAKKAGKAWDAPLLMGRPP